MLAKCPDLSGAGRDLEAMRKALSETVEPIDDFAHAVIEKPEDIVGLFAQPFSFGCEADDPTTATAFDARVCPFGQPLNAIFGSDIGHWDVPDTTAVLAEAHEHRESGRLDASQFRDFVFGNAARMYTDANPGFFVGTALESSVECLRSGE